MNLKTTLHSFILVIPFVFSSCEAFIGKEIAKVSIDEISSENDLYIKEMSVELEQYDELHFWSEMDLEYTGDVMIRFMVNMYVNGELDEEFSIDPFDKDLTINEVKTDVMNEVKWKFSGRNLILNAQQDGTYSFKVYLATSDNETLKINKADLVLRK
ncbi:MAG: hypothetical protein OEW75_04885 [Cyclobacteriaceae bacterium]|nr:hypothetical protein [Cyclobacteriaceae bacterium]